MTTCPRCGAELRIHIMSVFNTDDLCPDCHDDEQGAPNYARAKAAEEAAVRAGNYNFPGIGLAPEDQAAIAAIRQQRRPR